MKKQTICLENLLDFRSGEQQITILSTTFGGVYCHDGDVSYSQDTSTSGDVSQLDDNSQSTDDSETLDSSDNHD
ncbi:hypothetical protein SAMN05192574_11637 [Mucilaginibacter gossypiicola]|uniref:Uncharacterized protein n=1 Tax=Mucilaginibacter gossypiicola TaxID=551995 RepID=A0A1H8TLF6_9SPHI|nr:hypothetical protein [Mucilaginibacter gossypiicola]SEO91685.1 hypothetical protein SAMN05192574_11637 [Mucilaginibacter gossypiicola]